MKKIKENGYNFELCKPHKKIHLRELDVEIIKWLLKSKVSPEDIATFTNLNLSNNYIRRNYKRKNL